MLGWFPLLHRGELLYGGCARLAQSLGYPNKRTLLVELTNGRSAMPAIDIPAHLESLIRVMPPAHSYTADSLIDHHTLWPYYAPFLDQERQALSRACLMGNGKAMVTKFIGSRIYGQLLPTALRYCPVCREDDTHTFGEPLWHRLHQAPGVVVCPEHRVFLLNSTVLWRARRAHDGFIAAETGMPPADPTPLQPNCPSHIALIDLALDVAWLLEQSRLTLPIGNLRNYYRLTIWHKGFETSGSKAARAQLLSAMTDYYSNDSLWILNATRFFSDRHWITNLLTDRSQTGGHPLMHLLLAHFLGLRFQSLATLIGTTWAPISDEAA